MDGLKQWLGYQTDVLVSSLPIDECVSRLHVAVTEEGGATFGKEGVTGKVGGNTLRLRKALREGMHNSFQTYLRATLEREGMSTRLTCRFGPHRFVVVFMVFWVCLAFAIAVAILSINLQAAKSGDVHAIIPAVIPVMMVPMGVAIAAGGRYFARGERRFLLDFLRETIDARPQAKSDARRVGAVVQR